MDVSHRKWIHILPILVLLTEKCLGSISEQQLIYDLFEGPGYNPLIRPVKNISESITVLMGVTLFQVITVEERTQVMKTNNWIRMMWHDYQLTWDPNDYGGIKSIRPPCEEVWKPDIVLLNNADGKYEQSYCCNAVLGFDGTVMWIPPSIYKSSCTIDVKYFPFDQQECSMMFGSWTFSASQVQLGMYENKYHCDLSNYVFSGTWDLIACPATVNKTGKKYSEINYNIILRRKTLFYTVNLLTPCVLISFLSVLTFYLPADAQEKVTLCISILLALVVFLLLVSKSLPPTSVTMPLISKYLFFTFIMNIVTVVVSVAIININFRSPRTYKMPRWIRILFLNWLPIIMFMKRPEHEEKYARWKERKILQKEANNTLSRANGVATTAYSVNEHKFTNSHKTNHQSTKPSAKRKESLLTSPKALKALEAIDFITEHLKSVDDYDEVGCSADNIAVLVGEGKGLGCSPEKLDTATESICNDWKYVASVIDRFLLYVFLVITIAGTVSVIVDAPHIFEVANQEEIVTTIQGS